MADKETGLSAQNEAVQAQLEAISRSPELGGSRRLLEMLDFIITETLSGRAKYIKGTTIGQAVFDSSGEFDQDSNSVVRVEMGRLRRRLAEFYSGTGQYDPVVITIPKGSYVPQFSINPSTDQQNAQSGTGPAKTPAKKWYWLAAVVVFFVAGVLFGIFQSKSGNDVTAEKQDSHYLQNRSTNPEAQSLFEQAFVLLMPPEEGVRLSSSIGLFQRVIELDENFPGGFAGKSIGLSFRAFFLKSDNRLKDVQEAQELAGTAVAKDSGYSLGHAAFALATAMAGNPDKTMESARQTVSIRPPDPNAYAISAFSLIISGNQEEAIDQLSKALQLNPDEPRTPYLNMLGAAHFVNGDYENAAVSFERNLDNGGPSGAHVTAFLAASYAMLGEDFEAQAILAQLQSEQPDFPVRQWFSNFMSSRQQLDEVMERIAALGYKDQT